MSKDILTIAVVNFRLDSSGYEKNLDHIEGYAEAASKRGADLIVFPEMCATGYDLFAEKEISAEEKYQLAKTASRELTGRLSAVTKKYGTYVVAGSPEPTGEGHGLYNSALTVFPDGHTESYHKIHPYGEEKTWCTKGTEQYMIPSEWGPIGISICYDTYQFPELIRHYAKNGARLVLNVTAELEDIRYAGSRETFYQYYSSLDYQVMSNEIFLASANLTGWDRTTYFAGGSVILGPKQTPFGETVCDVYGGGQDITAPGISMATVDLSMAGRRIFASENTGREPDFRGELYKSWG